MKRNWWVLSSASLVLARKREEDPQGGTRGRDDSTRRKTQGAGILEGWEDKLDGGKIPDTST